ncbi:hypothetical protein, partial [Oleomonas cavernae]|uniref:hypothetical protein n=1 Tax=Oleomonas cavernae TaxID=2320859 RepID=UPI0018F48827
RGLGPTLLPRPQRYYFGFGQSAATAHLQGREGDKEVVWELREQVARAVEQQIGRLLRYRAEDRLQTWSLLPAGWRRCSLSAPRLLTTQRDFR